MTTSSNFSSVNILTPSILSLLWLEITKSLKLLCKYTENHASNQTTLLLDSKKRIWSWRTRMGIRESTTDFAYVLVALLYDRGRIFLLWETVDHLVARWTRGILHILWQLWGTWTSGRQFEAKEFHLGRTKNQQMT